YLVLGTQPAAVATLKWLYRWPLFIPFIVAAQCMRTFLAKNGMLNNALDMLGLVDISNLSGLLDWRGIIVTFVWKETPFVDCSCPARWRRSTAPASRPLAISEPATCASSSRSNSYSDYGVANALGFISYLIAGVVAWIYVRHIVGVPDVTTLPLIMFTASLAGNYQIAAVTALILLVPSIAFMLHDQRRFADDDHPRHGVPGPIPARTPIDRFEN